MERNAENWVGAPETLAVRRPNWWTRWTSFGWDRPQRSIEQRELARRSRLASWIILGLLLLAALLAFAGINDPGTLSAVGVFALGLVIAAALNRRGFVAAAGVLIVALFCLGDLSSLLSQPGGELPLDALPAYDLLAVPVIVAASVLPRAAAFLVAGATSALILTDFLLQPHYKDLATDLQFYGGPAAGTTALLVRPIALQIIVAVVAYLWVRGTDDAIRRADRAEELAAMEHQLADQKRQLDVGIRQILDTHIRVANGDFNARAPLTQDNILFQIAASLNNLLNRLARAGQAEYLYQRTVAEIHRLRQSLEAAKAGRPPLWPMRSGTPVDDLLTIIAGPGPTNTASQLPPMPGPQSGFGPGSGSSVSPGPNSGPWGMSGVSGASPGWASASSAPWGERGPTQEGAGWAEPAPQSPWDMPPVPDWLPPSDPNSRG